ncbi:hypothetical protein T09_8302 [Trichinella sp. T9]|nr:hypothetical protein T09_8302 [Trichinella sp. T9]
MGVCPVKVSKTLVALVKRSPDSPTQMFKHSLRMQRFGIGLKANNIRMKRKVPEGNAFVTATG